ncbi:sensory neuron membrane protein 1 isoform X1 [Megalopta genalis]|uniref:sensory neuron membrane protein 1 isoform X1 n=2 Tax=Megalopta genalis TaxID=115081 RepID=UPI003FD2B22B
MRVARLAYNLGGRLLRRSINFSLYTSLLGLLSFVTTGRKLRDKLPNVSKYISTMKPKKMGIIGGSMFSFGLFFLTFTFPTILRSQVKKQVALKPGSEMRGLWSNLPFPLDFKVYLFNVTNPVEITAGQKPILQEVGPFFYDQYKEKVDQVDNDEEDSIEYNVKVTWYFNPALSNGLTGDEELYLPNLLALLTLKFVMKEQPGAVGVVNKAVDSIFKKPSTIFMKVKAKDILFDGVKIDCNVKDFGGTTVCNALKEKKDNLIPSGDNIYLLSLFGPKNGTIDSSRIKVLRGMKNHKDLGRVIAFKGEPALTIYSGERCNTLNGTDSTIFPPLMTKLDDIVSFSPEICRSISAPYRHDSKIKGVNTYHYSADFGDMKGNPEDSCYCPTPETCLDKDLMDLEKCMGIPLIGSQPHFLGTDEKYLEMVDGLHPNPAKHDLSMDFEPLTASPLSAHKRLQFSMFVGPVEKFKLMKTFPECLFPIFWVDEGVLLDDSLVSQVKQVYLLIGIVGFMKYLMMVGGAGLGAAAGALHYKNRNKNSLDVTKVTPESRNGKDGEKKWPPQQQMNISTIQTQSAAVPPNLDAN